MTLVIRGLDEKTKRLLRAEAIKRGLKLSEAVKEAVQLWRTYDEGAEALSEREVNNAVYSAIRQELEPHVGKTVVIAKGKLFGIYDSPREAAKDLDAKAPEARHAIVTVIGKDKAEELEWLAGSLSL